MKLAPWMLIVLAGGSSLTVTAGAGAQDTAGQSAQMSEPSPVSDPLQNGKINDDDPESTILTPEQAMKNPLNMGYLMMALSDRADKAAARGDHSKEAKYWRAVAKAAPDRAIGYRRACMAHEAAHELDKAIDMCRKALGAGGLTVDDHLKFLNVLLKSPTLSDTDVADADAVVERLGSELKLDKDEAGRKVLADARCQIAAKLEDPNRLDTCVKALQAAKAEPAKLFTYRWAQAVAEGDAEGAKQVIANARQAGIPAAALETMERGLVKAREVPAARIAKAVAQRWWPVAALIAALGLVIAGLRSRRSRPQAA